MADYIDRGKLIEAIKNDCSEMVYYTKSEAIDCINAEPTADVAPVIHGRWVKERQIGNHFMGSGTSFHCSVCGRKAGHNQVKAYHYCPRCGAKMDKED